jgi:hypothetical protein
MNNNHHQVSPPLLESLIRDLFEHQVILLSSWAQRTHLSDRQRWELARLLDSSWRRVNRRAQMWLPYQDRRAAHRTVHPAFRILASKLAEKNRPDSWGCDPVGRSRGDVMRQTSDTFGNHPVCTE